MSSQALADNECGLVTNPPTPATIACGSGSFTNGITYDNADTGTNPVIFTFTNTQATDNSGTSRDAVNLSTNDPNQFLVIEVRQLAPGAAPVIVGGSAIFSADGFNAATTGDGAYIDMVMSAGSISGGTSSVTGSANGLDLSTDGDGSYITFTQSGGSISGGSALTGSASGLLLSSGDDNSPVSYYLTGGTVAGGTSNLLGDAVGVGIYTDGSNSPITVETSTGTTVTGGEALVGFSDGMQLFTTGGSDITATINGNISAPNTTLGEGVAAGLFASASGGDGIVGLTIGETSTVSGSAAGVIGIAEGAGTSTVNVYGNVNQTSASAGYLPLLGTVGVPVGVAAITTGSGDATATTHAGSTVTQSGDLSLVGTGGVGVVAWADGTGNAFATANGNVTARGVGVAAVAAGGGDATALSTASINVTGTSSPALLGATVGLLAQANDGNASASLIGGNVGIVLGQEPDIGVAAVVGLGGTGDATVTVGDGAAQSSLVNANGVGLLGVNLGTGNVMISSETADPEGDMNIVNSDGVGVAGFALDGNVDITTGIVNSNLGGGGGLGGSGVLGIAVGGDATVTTEGKTSVADGGLIGAGALSIDGNATVTVNGVIDPPVIGAISAAFGAGTATTNVNALTQATGLGAGAIQIGGPTGDAIVTTSAAIQSDFMGIGALNVGGEGNIDIDVDGSVSGLTGANVGYNGIMAVSLFNEGNVNVDTTANGTIAADNDGIQVSKVFGPGSVLVNTSAAISAGDEGIEVLSLGNDGNISIITNTGSTIVAGDDGISSLRYFGDGDLYVSADDAIDAGDDGIESVSIDSEGDVNIATQNGGTAGDGSDGGTIVAADDGISVVKVLGGGDVNVYANADINAGDEAIGIFRTLSGGAGSTINVGVDGTSTLVSGQNGIEVFTPLALNDVNVTVGTGSEVLSDDGVAVSVGGFSLLGDNNVTVTSDGLLRGEGSLLEPVVFVGTDGTSTIRNTDNGVIVSDTGDWDDDAIISLAGSDIEVYNSGDVTGQMKLISFDSYAMIDNSGDWETSGINMIYGLNGDATLNNSGMIETDGLTLFSFASAGGDSIVNNSGEIYVNGLTSFGGPLFGIDDFNNSGLVSMVNGVSDYGLVTLPVYGSGIGDMTIVAGNYNGMGGALAVDAALGAVGSSSSDMLVITGDVDGSTEVYVNNVGGFGAYNPIGIPVVGVLSGNTDLGDFVLANGPIDTGLFTYDLFLDAPADPAQWTPGFAPDAKAWVLASYADSSAFMFAQTVSIAQNMWHTTADGYLDRSSDLREIYGSTGTGYSTANADFIEAAPPPAAPAVNNNDNGVWLRGIGQYAESEGSESFEAFPGQFVSFNTDYNETIWGIEGGVDHAFHLNNGSTLVLGLMGGYVTNSVEFSGVGDTATVDGGMAGVYATWVNGPGYIDALFKADFLTADFSVGGSPASSDILNLGGRIEGGYRFTNASGYYIEPVASLAYVNTSVDDLTVLGTGVQIEDGDSLRGKIGGRLGTTMIVGNGKLDPYINAYVGGEFLGDNSAVIAGLSLQDDISGVFGEVGAGFNWYNATNNWSVYGQANYIFADEYWAGNGTLGVRYSW